MLPDMDRIQTDIVIAGGGVAGLVAAAAFGTAGFGVILVDPAAPVTDPAQQGADLRTTAFLQPARDFLDQAGIWPHLADHATPLQIMRIVDAAATPHVTRDFNASDISALPFGWNLPNWLLRREILARLAQLPNVTLRMGVGFSSMLARLDRALVRLDDGSQIAAKLVIGADGRNSAVRRALGIGVQTRRYGQKALTFAVTHDAPHDNISTEIHRAGGPFTLVPLPDHQGRPCSAVVWMDHGAQTLRRAALDAATFEAEANDRSALLYGPLRLASARMVWPMISQTADQITAARCALVAEAAHVMPPIGAQGLNMSLRDLACLLDLASATPTDLGSPAMLAAYARARHGDIKLRVWGIDALNRTSMLGNAAAQDLRARGIKALYGIAPLRRGLMQLGLGAR